MLFRTLKRAFHETERAIQIIKYHITVTLKTNSGYIHEIEKKGLKTSKQATIFSLISHVDAKWR